MTETTMEHVSFLDIVKARWHTVARRGIGQARADKKLRLLVAMLRAQGQRPDTLIFSAPFFHELTPPLTQIEIATLVNELQQEGAILRVPTGYILAGRRAFSYYPLSFS
jgi:hypothetical protein